MFNFSFYVAQIVLTGCHVDKIEIWRERTWSQASCLPTHTYIHIFVCEQDFLFAVSSIFFFAVCPGFFLCHSQCAKLFCLHWNNILCIVGHLLFIYLSIYFLCSGQVFYLKCIHLLCLQCRILFYLQCKHFFCLQRALFLCSPFFLSIAVQKYILYIVCEMFLFFLV